ncbi:6-aminohexanoate hydrolase [Bacillus wiedmannii]|uniref:6-aminohexanoate hydrolase n=1 Tax=Bacillus wiedmannii TaxID=1890302 RepID=A0A4U2ML18_9BACI|nr:6-aminohexanoate hydrolase [Bacillus wiedmannii]TKH11843.1 6-aminohexanoate hydrolase [Bacillus wiedmannii]TKI91244.1 6-aminohexanoate hydrolase [Bacillus wiedmannii]
MIDLLDRWISESSANFNVFVSFTTLLWLGSAIVLFIIGKKFGRPDERTNGIYFKIISCMFLTQLLMNGLFISWINKGMHFRQFFILFEAIVFFVGAIYSFRLYRKEFK